MKKKLVAVLGALSLVACGGSGKPWSGEDGPSGSQAWPAPDAWSTGAAGSQSISVGGYDATGGFGVGGTSAIGGYETGGGFAVGGTSAIGGYEAGGGFSVGGTGIAGSYEAGGYSSAGTGYGGFQSGGTGSQYPACLQQVVHCFDAAANCYQYSASSDCDQIVDVCAAMQMDCNE